jgi:hypothetical protein
MHLFCLLEIEMPCQDVFGDMRWNFRTVALALPDYAFDDGAISEPPQFYLVAPKLPKGVNCRLRRIDCWSTIN